MSKRILPQPVTTFTILFILTQVDPFAAREKQLSATIAMTLDNERVNDTKLKGLVKESVIRIQLKIVK